MVNMLRFFVLALSLAATVAPALPARSAPPTQTVVLAGGCFWGMQLVFEQLRGVQRVVAGYSGGAAATADYEIVSTGVTGHAESVQITYDPNTISFGTLLDVYFKVAHDPTQLNRQGPDTGSNYRSEIFYTTDAQRDEAVETINRLRKAHYYPDPIVTIVAPLRAFYPAEAYHQDFALHNPHDPYIAINDLPKLHRLRELFGNFVKPNAPDPA
jgi:peptide-methionine (S)-S-oxide reductase